MEEILFRAKRRDNGKWIEGFYVYQHGCHYIYLPSVDGEHGFDNYTIHPNTLSRYAELKDKNGTKIFEGDLVQYYGSHVLEVYIEKGHTKIRWLDKASRTKCSELFFGYDEAYGEVEIIGNVYDNPELSKGDSQNKK